MDANYTYCGNHFTIYTNIESCATETNIMLYVNYITI